MQIVEELRWCCFRKGYGFYKNIQSGYSIYIEFTSDITQAKVYKSKKAAASSLRYKNPDHNDLVYYEVKIVTHYPDVEESVVIEDN